VTTLTAPAPVFPPYICYEAAIKTERKKSQKGKKSLFLARKKPGTLLEKIIKLQSQASCF
jgi:hypothetical protein